MTVRMSALLCAACVFLLQNGWAEAQSQRNLILFVPDGLRALSVTPEATPAMAVVRDKGANFINPHSLFPTFTMANASGMSTGHFLGDTGTFSNTIYTGFPVAHASNSVTPFIEADPVLADIDEHFSGNFVDEDAILRRNALNGFADRMAVVDGARRAPILRHAQLGILSIRDIEIATGHLPLAEGETASMDEAQLNALLAASAVEDLQALASQLEQAVQSLKSIEEAMRSEGGAQAAPDFESLSTPLARTLKLLRDHLATRVPSESGDAAQAGSDANGAAAGGAVAVGAIRNRQDATGKAQVARLPAGRKKDQLLRKLRQLETASHISDWLSSPELKPPH